MNKKFFHSFILLSLFFLFFSSTSYANDEKSLIPFSVTPILPDNQERNIAHYYSLNMKPNDEQVIQLELLNNNQFEYDVSLHSANSLTAQNGDIEYISHDETNYDYFIDKDFALSTHIKVPKVIHLNANEKKMISISISSPSKRGEYLGGILFEAHLPNENKNQLSDKKDVSFELVQRGLYALATKVNVGNVDDTKQELSMGTIQSTVKSDAFQVEMELKNENPYILKNISGNYEIYSKNDELLFQGTFGPFNMAPMSKTLYPIHWDFKSLKQGDYKIVVHSDALSMKKSHETFSVEPSQVNEYKNNTNLSKPVAEIIPIWVWIGFGLLTISGIFIGVYLGRKRR